LCGAFAVCSGQRNGSSVHLDSGNDAIRLQHFDHRLAIAGLLVDRLVEEDDAADVLVQLLAAREQQLAVSASVFLDVLNVDLGQTLANCRCNNYIINAK